MKWHKCRKPMSALTSTGISIGSRIGLRPGNWVWMRKVIYWNNTINTSINNTTTTTSTTDNNNDDEREEGGDKRRSSNFHLYHCLLHVPFARTSIMQSRAFSVVGPLVWNGLPLALRSLPRVSSQKFLQQLKTTLFGRAVVGALLSSPTLRGDI